jgi:large subunit ribosomal protein L22
MKASLHSARIAPKKANIIAALVRGMPVLAAIAALERTHKKAARLVEDLLRSAVANATHNDKQDAEHLYIKTIIVNQGTALRRGVPMARGRMRPMKKFLSHIDVVLGVVVPSGEAGAAEGATGASQAQKNAVQRKTASKKRADTQGKSSSASSPSSLSSASRKPRKASASS